jgi:hypothetical protein
MRDDSDAENIPPPLSEDIETLYIILRYSMVDQTKKKEKVQHE